MLQRIYYFTHGLRQNVWLNLRDLVVMSLYSSTAQQHCDRGLDYKALEEQKKHVQRWRV